jgi:hypothetical protein
VKKTPSHEIPPRSQGVVDAPLCSDVPVFCKFDELIDAEELKPHPDNAHRRHPAKQLDLYESVIAGDGQQKGNGWRKSIVVSRRSGFITKGHGAWQMAKRRGWKVPVEYQSYGSLAEERRDLLADNKLPALAITDNEKLAKLLNEMDKLDLTMAGFTDLDLAKLLRESITEPEFPISAKLGERYDYVLIFTTNDTEFVHLQSLLGVRQERSYKKPKEVGLGRAVSFERAMKALCANRDSIDVAGEDNGDAPADTGGARLRSSEPAA